MLDLFVSVVVVFVSVISYSGGVRFSLSFSFRSLDFQLCDGRHLIPCLHVTQHSIQVHPQLSVAYVIAQYSAGVPDRRESIQDKF